MLETIAAASQGALRAAIFFGSRSSRVATTTASAYDFMLVPDDPGVFYKAMHARGLLARSPRVVMAVDHWLAPTQVRLAASDGVVKASVVSLAGLERAVSRARKDQFLAGRLFQDVKTVWVRDEESAALISRVVGSARRLSLDWVRPDLPNTFDARDYVRQLFRTSFRYEVRPETSGRADKLFDAQAPALVPAFERVLAGLAEDGELRVTSSGAYALALDVDLKQRLRLRLFLEWSRVRATARWPKHAITFDGWLDYIVRKAERHSGEKLTLTPLERRLPFVFLWPRAIGFLLRQRKRRPPV